MTTTATEVAGIYADAMADTLSRPSVAKARRDIHAFAEYVFGFKQAAHHVAFQTMAAMRRSVVWMPVEHGKTTQFVVLLCWTLGKFPTWQNAIICAKARQAYKVVGAVKREIESNPRLREVFPNLRPQRQALTSAVEEWGTTRIRVEGCPPGKKDASLAGYGIDGDISGSRLDLILMDNILDRYNTAGEYLRKRTLETIDVEILPRCLESGRVMIADTAWHESDAPHVIAGRPGWRSYRFDAETPIRDVDATLWPAQFSRERLDTIKGDMALAAYNRMYRSIALSASSGRFKEIDIQRARTGPWLDRYTGKHAIFTGVDLSTGEAEDVTAFVTVESLGDRWRVLNIQAGFFDGPEILKRIVAIYRRFHRGCHNAGERAIFRVESNAQQRYIIQLARSAEVMRAVGADSSVVRNIVVEGHHTSGFNKRDFDFGLPAISDDLAMGRLILPREGFEVDCLADEMKVWTPDLGHHTGDRLMALWIACSGARESAPLAAVV